MELVTPVTLTLNAADALFLQGVAWETSEKWRRKTKAWFLKGKAN